MQTASPCFWKITIGQQRFVRGFSLFSFCNDLKCVGSVQQKSGPKARLFATHGTENAAPM
jgi:hypothetical protein